jgi:hypothetical protein
LSIRALIVKRERGLATLGNEKGITARRHTESLALSQPGADSGALAVKERVRATIAAFETVNIEFAELQVYIGKLELTEFAHPQSVPIH